MSVPEVELQSVGSLLTERHLEMTGLLVEQFRQRIPELPFDPALVDLLHGSAGSNLESLAHVLRGHIPAAGIRAPAAAVEYARRLAQRGTSPSALLRAYRLGQQLVLSWANEQIIERSADPAVALAVTHRLTEISFQYIDAVSEDVMVAYQDERDRWLANRSAVQREVVEGLLRGDRLDLAAAETALAYRLRQHHLALVLWTDPGEEDADLGAVEREVARIAQRLDVAGTPLFVPRDRETGWAWLPLGRSATPERATVEAALAEGQGAVRVAVGRAGAGESGFRTTHLGAAAAQEVAVLGHHGGNTISFDDPTVRAAALLTRDLAATRHLVQVTLGELADGSRSAERMRLTLLTFIEARESYVATAARMHLHKNTVKYRVDKALEARGRPIEDDRLDLELALIACKWLGPEVLSARS